LVSTPADSIQLNQKPSREINETVLWLREYAGPLSPQARREPRIGRDWY
jgi:hypothetical protein